MCECAAYVSRRVGVALWRAHLQSARFCLFWHLCLGILLAQHNLILRASLQYKYGHCPAFTGLRYFAFATSSWVQSL